MGDLNDGGEVCKGLELYLMVILRWGVWECDDAEENNSSKFGKNSEIKCHLGGRLQFFYSNVDV